MALASIIAHHIHRQSPASPISTQARNDNFNSSGALEELAYELKTQFIRKGGKNYGRFSDNIGEAPFSAWLQDYRQERLSFASFTQKALQQFAQLLDNSESFINSHLFFIEENIEAGQYLWIYALEHHSGLYLDSDITLSDSMYLDTANFTLAAKINLTDWDSGDSATYVTLMRSRGDKDIADAFTHFIGFSDKHDVKTETAEFLQVVNEFTQTLDEPTARITRTKVADYCLEQNKAGKPVVIQDLSHSLATDIKSYEPSVFTRYVETQKPDIKPEFIPHAGQVRSFVRISGRNESLSMSFASECLGKEIEYDAERDVLTIKNLPQALKARLIKHLKQMG